MIKFLLLLTVFLVGYIEAMSVGALFVRPLRSTTTYQSMSIVNYDVTVSIQGHVATTHVDQLFTNELNQIVESTLIFPLPPGAIVTDMAYWFNGKRYVADVRERQAAQAKYDSKVRALIDPALLKEVGENLFQLNIAPIDPRSLVRAEITYVEVLPYASNTLTYTHLLKSTNVSPKPLQRVSVSASIRNRSTITGVTTPAITSNASKIDRIDSKTFRVTYGDENALPQRHLSIAIALDQEQTGMDVLTYQPVPSDSFGMEGFFATFVTPPDEAVQPLPKSIVVVADVSSSMTPVRMQQLRSALHAFVDRLEPNDWFNILSFSTNVTSMVNDLVPVNPETIATARAFIDRLTPLGLTNISDALRRALRMSYVDGSSKVVVFLTDGEPSWGITSHSPLVDSVVAWNTQSVRIFPIAIGDEPSDALLRNIAKQTNGYHTRVSDDDSIAIVVKTHSRRISLPVLRDAALDYGNLHIMEQLPAQLPEVPAGDRMIQVGRYVSPGRHAVQLSARMEAATIRVADTIDFGSEETNNRAVARLWAQTKISDLLDEIALYGERKELVDAVIALSIRYRILTRYTALYADPDEPPTGNPTSVRNPPEERPLEVVALRCTPMPVIATFTVTANVPQSLIGLPATIELLSLTGQVVAQLGSIGSLEALLQASFDLSMLAVRPAPGAYILMLRTSRGMATTTIIIQ